MRISRRMHNGRLKRMERKWNRRKSLEAAWDEADHWILKRAEAKYAGMDWRAISVPL